MVDFQCKDYYSMDDLLRIMELLRTPEGCPWDRAQTHQSIRRNMLEEAYEVAEAIDQQDPVHLQEELGDVLLQVVFHARMAQEAGQFDFGDVVDGICKKLVFRHPHVFGGVDARDSDAALTAWEAQKREEKGQKTAADTLDAVARSLPALIRAAPSPTARFCEIQPPEPRRAAKSARSSSSDTSTPATSPQNAAPMFRIVKSITVTRNATSAPSEKRPANEATNAVCSTRSMASPASVSMNAGGVASISRVNKGDSRPKAIASRPTTSAPV